MKNPQADYIDMIVKVAINPIMCSNHFLNKTTQTFTPGKRYALSKHKLKDYLTVAANQIVFELDAKSFKTNYSFATRIIDVLESREIPYYIFSSGGKGLHIEIWFEALDFQDKNTAKLYKDAMSLGFSYKNVRLWLWNQILEEAMIPANVRGVGKTVDSSCITFDDLHDKSKLLRVAGGHKTYYHKERQERDDYYKTFIPKAEFTDKQIKLKEFEKVKYPDKLETFKINEAELAEYLQSFIQQAEADERSRAKQINLIELGGYTGLASVKKIIKGMPVGKRALGAQILSIAMECDKLPHEKQEALLKQYVDNCGIGADSFTFDEAMGWLSWVRAQKHTFWSCGLAESAGVHSANECDYCKQINKESVSLLSDSRMLAKIKEFLDINIVGENDTKMLMFLLMLSKDFPSKTGSPGWNIRGDPSSQNIILSCDSSSGKSWITKQILPLFGEKDVDYFLVSRYTKSAINYYTEVNMDGKIIFIEELQGLDENTAQLRVWMSEGEVTLTTVEKEMKEDGTERNALRTVSTKGHPVFITNQAEGKIEEQLNNRSWVLSLNTTHEQTQKILSFQDEMQLHTEPAIKDIKTITDALRMLKPYHFIIPYANYQILNIPTHDIRSRRDYMKFLTLIKCSAYLHQHQRKKIIDEENGHEFIMCNLQDYEVAVRYSHEILGATFSGLTNQQIDLINFLRKSAWSEEFTISDLMHSLGKSQPYWYGQLQQLEDLGYVNSEKSPGKTSIYKLNQDKAVNVIKLPSREKLAETGGGKLVTYYESLDGDKIKILSYRETCKRLLYNTTNTEAKELVDQQKKFPDLTREKKSVHFSKFSSIEGFHFAGRVTKSDIREFVSKHASKQVPIADFYDFFKNAERHEIGEILLKMKTEGEIMETRPDWYALPE